ncbi:MAG: hypothetical protein ACKOPO_11130 [Novosphingobium sp.]
MFLRRKAPAIAACLLAAFLTVTYLTAYEFYRDVNLAWGNKAYWFPFLDTDTVLSAVRCLRADVDAYVFNPCDPQLRVFTYSPLWMGLTVFPVTEAWVPWIGLSWVIAYLAALFLLPDARGRLAMVALIAGTASSVSVYAMERGNNDLVIFVLASLAAVSLAREGRGRQIGYGFVLMAGLLKYYPLGAMIAAFREPARRFIAITVLSIAVTALAVFATWGDLVRVLRSIPIGQFYTDMFGAKSAGLTLVQLFGMPGWVDPAMRGALSLAALAIGLRLGLSRPFADRLAMLTPLERSFLLIGALMTCLCYFSAQNIGYRAINLILVLPALTALASVTRSRGWWALVAVAVALLWTGAWRMAWEDVVMADSAMSYPPRYLALFLRDLLWWIIIPVLIAAVVAMLKDGPIPRGIAGKFA